jgi:hypothetical protein
VAGVGGVIVGRGVAGASVRDGIGEDVGAADAKGDAVGDGRLAVGVPETGGLGLAAGAPQAATRARIRSATIDVLRNI